MTRSLPLPASRTTQRTIPTAAAPEGALSCVGCRSTTTLRILASAPPDGPPSREELLCLIRAGRGWADALWSRWSAKEERPWPFRLTLERVIDPMRPLFQEGHVATREIPLAVRAVFIRAASARWDELTANGGLSLPSATELPSRGGVES